MLTNVSLISFLGPSASISMASLGLGKFRFKTYFFFLSFFTKRLLTFHFSFFFRSFGFDFGSASLGLGKFRSETLKKIIFFFKKRLLLTFRFLFLGSSTSNFDLGNFFVGLWLRL